MCLNTIVSLFSLSGIVYCGILYCGIMSGWILYRVYMNENTLRGDIKFRSFDRFASKLKMVLPFKFHANIVISVCVCEWVGRSIGESE